MFENVQSFQLKTLINRNNFCSGQDESYVDEEGNKLNDSYNGYSSSDHYGATLRISDEEKYYMKNKEVILNN